MGKVYLHLKLYGGVSMFSTRSYYGYGSNLGSAMTACAIIALIGGIVLYFLFLTPKNDRKFTGFVGWLYDFLAFKKLLVEAILKIVYLISACFMTLAGIVTLFNAFGAGLGMLIVGNIMLRLTYEFLLVLIIICKNTSDINKKLSGKEASASDMFVSQVEIPQVVMEQFTAKTTQTAPVTSAPKAFCKNCGQPMKEDSLFCPNCGQKSE